MKLCTYAIVALAMVFSGCYRRPDMTQPYIALADKFARALAAGRFEDAHALLSTDAKAEISAATLKSEYEGMIAYGGGPATHVEVMQAMSAWPAKQMGDVGWVYVAIASDSFSEAVTVIIAQSGDHLAIRSVEWGRP